MIQYSDVIVVGAGPAGLALATLVASEGRSVTVLEKHRRVGGQISHSHWVENTPPFSMGFTGNYYSNESLAQCKKFFVDVRVFTPVDTITRLESTGYFLVNEEFMAKAVVLATGLLPSPAGFPITGGEGCQVLTSPELSPINWGDTVLIYGAGNSAGQAAVYYADQGAIVTILSRRSAWVTMSSYLLHHLNERGVRLHRGEIAELGDSGLRTKDGAVYHPDRVHIFTGMTPSLPWLPGSMVETDEEGYIIVDRNHMTSTAGLFAIGDCVRGNPHRLLCATGDAAMTVPHLHEYLDANMYLDR